MYSKMYSENDKIYKRYSEIEIEIDIDIDIDIDGDRVVELELSYCFSLVYLKGLAEGIPNRRSLMRFHV